MLTMSADLKINSKQFLKSYAYSWLIRANPAYYQNQNPSVKYYYLATANFGVL